MKLSVITVFKLGEISELERTIASVRHQKLLPHQHIIVISGVGDDDAQIVQYFVNDFTSLIINQDQSLYHAMNIGLETATGDALLFLNGGDEFFGGDAIEKISSLYKPGCCLAFRALQYYHDDIYIRPSYKRMTDLYKWPSHQAFVAPMPCGRHLKYDEKKVISADTKWMRQLIGKCGVITSEQVLVKFSLGGISNMPSVSTVIMRSMSEGMAKGIIEISKLIIRLFLGNRSYYRFLLARKCDTNHQCSACD